jgi:murein DD-endopeptidase MepM/ murein hydrolase activator NlpD
LFYKSAVTYQSAVFGSDFMCQFKQKPAHIKHRKPAHSGVRKPLFSFLSFRKPVSRRLPADKAEKSAGFSFPVPSLMTLAVIAGTLLISLVALNSDLLIKSGEGLPPRSPKISLQPAADTEGQRSLAAYAGIPSFGELSAEVSEKVSVTTVKPEKVSDTAIPLDLMETFNWSTYTVQGGDSVSKIAAQFGVSMDAVIASNDIKNARRLREGETLRIPNMDGIPYTVKKGDSLLKIAKTYSVPLEIILDVNDIRSDVIAEGQTLFVPGAKMAPDALRLALGETFIYPIRKKISSAFGWRISPITGERHFHAALDLSANTGTPVKAVMDASVSAVSVDRVFGNYIILSHAGGYQTLYAHLSAVSVKEGMKVTQGAKIGEVGSTGLSTGPHLHFAVFKNGKAVNPLDLLH